jgi:hypothetical protein
LQADLPHSPVSGIVVQEHFNDLVISTYGRGFFILDDIGPLQQLTPEVTNSAAHLFALRAAYRFRTITNPSSSYDDPTTGEDPEYGASINYWLKAPAAQAPVITILDAQGRTVRTLRGTNRAGINRVTWDLRDEPGAETRLYTSPRYAPHIAVGPEGRVAPGTGRLSVLVAPGSYTVKFHIGGAEQSRLLEVRKDPNTAGSAAEIAEQIRLLEAIRADMNSGSAAVMRAERVRVQLGGLRRAATDPEVRRLAEALETKLADAEMPLVDLRQTGTGQDGVRFAAALLANLNYLANGLAGGDFRPTNQQVEVQALLKELVRTNVGAIDALLANDLAALNSMLKAKNVPNVIGGGAAVVP